MCVKLIVTFAVFIGLIQTGTSIQCYECSSRLAYGEYDPCLYGDEMQLRRVSCIGPSVCATYHYQTVINGYRSTNHITRGCQAISYGATCEDIFHQLRARNEILPGQHTCTTCSSDFCNSALKISTSTVFVAFTILIYWILNC